MVWSVDWWTVLGWAGVGLGLVGVMWALFWDRARGRKRCPKCWYDMSGAKAGEGDALRCPECGRIVKREKELRRTRRRWRWAVPATVVVLVAGTMHDPAGVRSRGWVALVPTPVLVMIAPVGEVINPAGQFSKYDVWNERATDVLVREIYWRLAHGNMSGWEARIFFDRVEERHVDFADRMILIDMPRTVGGYLVTSNAPDISIAYPPHAPFFQGAVSLPSRIRFVGANQGEWHHACDCDWHRYGSLYASDVRPGRYIVERQFYLPVRGTVSGSNPGPPGTPTDRGEDVFRASRRIWTIQQEVVVDPSVMPALRGVSEQGLDAYLAERLDFDFNEIAVDDLGRAWLLRRSPSSSLTEGWGDLAIGLVIEVFLDDEQVGVARTFIDNPAPGRSINRIGNDAVPIELLHPIRDGDELRLVIRGDQLQASLDETRAEYWDGEFTMQAGPAVRPKQGDSLHTEIEHYWQQRHTMSSVKPLKE